MNKQTIYVVDEQAPVFTSVPENLTVNCLEVPPMEALVAVDDCGIAEVNMDEFTTVSDCGSQFLITRIWTASDACQNEAVVIQEIEVIDDIAPILTNLPTDIVVDCGEIPEPADVGVIESCGETVVLGYSEEIIELSDGLADCTVGNATGFGGDLALWLPGLEGIGENYVYGPEGGNFTQDPVTGRAMLTGVVYGTQNTNHKWYIELVLDNELSWEEWSALGRGYKDDLGIADDFYQDWTFYILNSEETRLTGMGALEGSELFLSHMPGDYSFGFQLGMNANNHSEGFGLGGWFFYSGQVNGQSVAGHGDFFTVQSCCPEQHIIRTWIAVDCAGNATSFTQNIYVVPGSSIAPFELDMDVDDPTNFDVRGSMSEEFIIDVTPDFNGRARVELFDSHGRRIALVREWDAVAGAVYTFKYPKSMLAPGMYVFMFTGNNRISTDSEMVMR